jgi:hypothetical protein
MSIGVHKPDTRRHIYIILYNDLLVDNKRDVVADVDPIFENQFRLIENPSAKDIHLPEEVDIIADKYFGVTNHKRQSEHTETRSDRFTPPTKERLPEQIAEQPARGIRDRTLEVKSEPEQRMQKTRKGQRTCLNLPSCRPQRAVKRRFTPAHFQK